MQKILSEALTIYETLVLPLYVKHQICDLGTEADAIRRCRERIADPAACLRSNMRGHFTGSAFVVNPSWERVILTLHRKLGKWLQLGGHSDGNPDLGRVAMVEVEEESGVTALEGFEWSKVLADQSDKLFKAQRKRVMIPFDIDIHKIPSNKKEGAHEHFDFRFLFLTDQTDLRMSDESKDLQWCSLSLEDHEFPTEPSMLKQREKALFLRGFAKLD